MHTHNLTNLYLIRHAQCVANQNPDIVAGQSLNSPVSETGIQQSLMLRQWLKINNIKFKHVFSSPAPRAVSTAKMSLEWQEPQPAIILDDRLLEYSAGDWEGQPRVQAHTDQVIKQMQVMGIDFTPPNGESLRMVGHRTQDFLLQRITQDQSLHATEEAVNIGIFSHGLAIKCLLHNILGFDSHMIWKLEIANVSVSLLTFSSQGWRLRYINRIPY